MISLIKSTFSQVPCYLRTHLDISKKILKFQYKYPSLESLQSTLKFSKKLKFPSIFLSYYLEVVVRMFLCCFGPLGLNSLEGVACSSWSQAINFLLTNLTLEKLSYLEWSRALVHASKVSKSLFNYALVLFNSSMFYFKFFICFLLLEC